MSRSAEAARLEPGLEPALDAQIAIIGAGFAGIGMAVELQRRGHDSFVILERAEEVGGTWRDNRYPGVAVDIPSFTYSFSYAQRPDWSRLFAHGHELQRYAELCVDAYQLRPRLRFRASVQRVDWHEDARAWSLTLADGRALRVRYVISATGLFSEPKWPDIPGLSRFAGDVVHTARWPRALDLRHARVAVIGTGATAIQLVPELARVARTLTVFQRTPSWVLPKLDVRLTPLLQAALRTVPGLQASCRALTSLGTEAVLVLAIVYPRQFPLLVRAIEQICFAHLRVQVRDPALRAQLTPRYGFGCNRPTFSNSYLAAFNGQSVRLETGGIREISPDGVITRDGRLIEADVLICATGFKTYERGNLPTYSVFGRGGVELGALWQAQRYQAYHGSTVPGFPNHFLIVGPYTATGSSWFSIIENQARHIGRCLDRARTAGQRTIEVRQEAHQRFFTMIQRRQRSTVFYNNGCGASHSYYFDKHGDALFYRPASGLEAWLESHLSPLDDYQFS